MFAYFYARTLAAGVDPNSVCEPESTRWIEGRLIPLVSLVTPTSPAVVAAAVVAKGHGTPRATTMPLEITLVIPPVEVLVTPFELCCANSMALAVDLA
ncbi:uncharacterized protein N7496_007067 [Penicillium cataractarum]|uniref:Uncharacterized protein n=1 Tax=Penicillium cataractarum TaxID=2100454 RepID=A0A9W9V955_9EURO|nr:uncharacterized protein N7496_007067 [Penicillium cataractarum]KAJ5370975.1 hypothetical protein N7496_007067 [Penicillium cataractarum]